MKKEIIILAMKLKTSFGAVGAIITAFLMPVMPLLLIMIGFIMLDTITAVYVIIKIEGKKHFRSHFLFNIVPKSFLYLSSILMAFLLDKFLVEPSAILGIAFFLSKGMLIFWSYIECVSINENSMKLGNRSFGVVLKEILSKIKGLKKDLTQLKKTEDE